MGLVFGIVMKNVNSNLQQLKQLSMKELDFSQIQDGSYRGQYRVFPISAEVEVVISNLRILSIELLKHEHGQGEDGEKVINQVVMNQKLQVDTISGATYSSIVILKAIQNALENDYR